MHSGGPLPFPCTSQIGARRPLLRTKIGGCSGTTERRGEHSFSSRARLHRVGTVHAPRSALGPWLPQKSSKSCPLEAPGGGCTCPGEPGCAGSWHNPHACTVRARTAPATPPSTYASSKRNPWSQHSTSRSIGKRRPLPPHRRRLTTTLPETPGLQCRIHRRKSVRCRRGPLPANCAWEANGIRAPNADWTRACVGRWAGDCNATPQDAQAAGE